MVRVNLINPKNLADQHLIAEYNEILMLFAYVKKHPAIRSMPKDYCLGKGHIIFFKDKLSYLKKRHELIKKEMRKRGFRADKRIVLKRFGRKLRNDWKPCKSDLKSIKKRLIWKIRQKPGYYRYYRKKKSINFFVDIIKKSR